MRNKNIEIWKCIVGYEGIYQISNFGNVKSIKRKGVCSDRLMIPQINKGGYKSVMLRKNNTYKVWTIHKLIALAFISNPHNKRVVNHIDSNKLNNEISNLEWVTSRENVTHYHLTKETSSKFTGVSWSKQKGKWRAYIKINSKQVNLGLHDNEIDASNSYQNYLQNYNMTLNQNASTV